MALSTKEAELVEQWIKEWQGSGGEYLSPFPGYMEEMSLYRMRFTDVRWLLKEDRSRIKFGSPDLKLAWERMKVALEFEAVESAQRDIMDHLHLDRDTYFDLLDQKNG